MTHIKETLGREIQDLLALRDQLKVKMKLAKSELRESWEKIERHWPDVQQKFRDLDKPSLSTLEELGKSLMSALSEIRREYRRIERGEHAAPKDQRPRSPLEEVKS
jgi:chromosome segregation ATPase